MLRMSLRHWEPAKPTLTTVTILGLDLDANSGLSQNARVCSSTNTISSYDMGFDEVDLNCKTIIKIFNGLRQGVLNRRAPRGAEKLAAGLSNLTSLKVLNLSSNEIEGAGANLLLSQSQPTQYENC